MGSRVSTFFFSSGFSQKNYAYSFSSWLIVIQLSGQFLSFFFSSGEKEDWRMGKSNAMPKTCTLRARCNVCTDKSTVLLSSGAPGVRFAI